MLPLWKVKKGLFYTNLHIFWIFILNWVYAQHCWFWIYWPNFWEHFIQLILVVCAFIILYKKNNFIGAGFNLGARDLKNSGKYGSGLNCRWALSLVIFTMFIIYDWLSWKIKKGKKFKILLEIMHESLKKCWDFFLIFKIW